MWSSPMLMSAVPVRIKTRRVANSLTFQSLGIALASIVVPLIVSFLLVGASETNSTNAHISVAVSLISAITALIIVRRVTSFPGTHHFAYIIPAFCITFGASIGLLLAFRLDYSTIMLLSGFLTATLFTFVVAQFGAKARLSFYLLPFGSALALRDLENIDWIVLSKPTLPSNDAYTPIVADLRHDLDPAWERLLAAAAISGRAVYHCKQLSESLTGKVEIEHLSENSFGSLLPNMAYRKLKRIADILISLIAIPLLVAPVAVLAIAIRMESPGPALFRQRRMGYRGIEFEVLKFRTMRERPETACEESRRQDAITQHDDDRVTSLGRFLRRSRIDELPQIWNVLLGQMSLIGPRPEAIPLSEWYERELPFYSYRHIVRPGITGWAQVNQGHVADLDSVHTKLHYDFYYVKNFSAWLDVLITLRTIYTVLSGFGSK